MNATQKKKMDLKKELIEEELIEELIKIPNFINVYYNLKLIQKLFGVY